MEMQKHIKQFDEYYSKKQGQFWMDGVNDYWVRKAYNDRNKRICEIVDVLNPQSILDIGCGTGDLALLLRGKNREISGLEPSVINLEKFVENTKMACYHGVAESMPYSDNSFDIVIMADVIEHVVDTPKALQEALRVLKVGGHLILTTPNKWADILWSFGSKRMFVKSKVKDNLYGYKELLRMVGLNHKHYNISAKQMVEGIYPRSRLLSWLFSPNSIMMMNILRGLGKLRILRYRQIVVIRKLK